MSKKILLVVGARPNFMKAAPLYKQLARQKGVDVKIVHTGQHFDERMSDIFFRQLKLPRPHFNLEVGGGSHAWQTAHVMLKFEEVLDAEKPQLVVVFGDVNATVACSVVTVKKNIRLAHVEAGLRSFDRKMPEEINRIITDSVSDYLFVSEYSGLINLANEGVPNSKVFFTGNIMIDSLNDFMKVAGKLQLKDILGRTVKKQSFALLTMHRPQNVDNKENLQKLVKIINAISPHKTVVFPIHPRTLNNLKQFKLDKAVGENVLLLPPQGYCEFIKLMQDAYCVITDSGGVQEETTFLNVPCLTLRDTTERPVTIELGTNRLQTELNAKEVMKWFHTIDRKAIKGVQPPFWDGRTAERITGIISNTILKQQ
jgi:UDP-N-acetylglucosamine 2-epimerase (non-hydrolysing)